MLCVAYAGGFQVWDVPGVGDGHDGAQELLSRRDGLPVKALRFLPAPLAQSAPSLGLGSSPRG